MIKTKTEAERWSAYLICKERGHAPSNISLPMDPPMSVCIYCGTWYRFEPRVIEGNAPKEPSK